MGTDNVNSVGRTQSTATTSTTTGSTTSSSYDEVKTEVHAPDKSTVVAVNVEDQTDRVVGSAGLQVQISPNVVARGGAELVRSFGDDPSTKVTTGFAGLSYRFKTKTDAKLPLSAEVGFEGQIDRFAGGRFGMLVAGKVGKVSGFVLPCLGSQGMDVTMGGKVENLTYGNSGVGKVARYILPSDARAEIRPHGAKEPEYRVSADWTWFRPELFGVGFGIGPSTSLSNTAGITAQGSEAMHKEFRFGAQLATTTLGKFQVGTFMGYQSSYVQGSAMKQGFGAGVTARIFIGK